MSLHRTFLLLGGMLAVCLLGGALVGCSNSSDEDSFAANAGPYAAQFEQEIQYAHSDYVKTVLSDGKVDPSELQDAEHQVMQCAADVGIDVHYETTEFGINFVTSIGLTSSQNDAVEACDLQWMGGILTLYWNVYSNPNNEDKDALWVACLVRKGLAPEGFTVADMYALEEAQAAPAGSSTMFPDFPGDTPVVDLSTVILPSGVALNDYESLKCQFLPLQ